MKTIQETAALIQRVKTILHGEGLAGAQLLGALCGWALAVAEDLGMTRNDFKAHVDLLVATVEEMNKTTGEARTLARTPEEVTALVTKSVLFNAGVDLDRALATLAESGSDIKGADLNTACVVVVGDLKGAESGRDFWKREYECACETIAKMHGAAVGKFGDGPKRGVVEDVEDLRAERDALRVELAKAKGGA